MKKNEQEPQHLIHLAQKARIDNLKSTEERHNPWGVYDSPLQGGFPKVPPNGKSIESSFQCVLPPERKDIRRYIETQLAPFSGRAVGIEFGGTGSNLFADFSTGFFSQSAGVNLADRRGRLARWRDARRNHSVIAGDMNEADTQTQLLEWLDGRQAHVIFERMVRGLEYVPNDLELISQHTSWWYRLLAEGGLMFVQAPRIMLPLIDAWREKVSLISEGNIEIRAGLDGVVPWPSVHLIKHPGAPSELPLLTVYEVKRVLNDYRGEHRPRVEDYMHEYYQRSPRR